MDTVYEQEGNSSLSSEGKVENNVWYAGFWMRLWAYGLDLLIISSLHRLIVYPALLMLGLSREQTSIFSAATIGTAIVGYAYLVLMTKFFQQTLGKMVFGLKVINKDGKPPSWMTVIFREVVGKFISKTVLFIGFIWAAFSNKKQAWHDKIADTYVIHER